MQAQDEPTSYIGQDLLALEEFEQTTQEPVIKQEQSMEYVR